MTETTREFRKGGANIHVKSHYRIHNGKLVYVHEHEKASQTGHEAQLHERVQFGKNKAHLLAIDPEDRDTITKHASALGIKHEVKYQGGKIRDHEGNVEKHGFHYVKFENEEDAKRVHGMLSGKSEPADGTKADEHPEPPVDTEANPEAPKTTHPNDAVKAAESKLQGFISIGHAQAIQHALSGGLPAEKGVELADQGIELAQGAIDAAEAYEKETGQKAPNAQTYHEIMAKLNTWKAQLQEKVKRAEAPKPEEKPAEEPKGDTTGPAMGLTAQHSVTDPSGKKWDVIKASKDHGDVVLEDADGKKKKISQHEMKEKGWRKVEDPSDEPDMKPRPDTSGETPKTMEQATQKKIDTYVSMGKEAMANGKTIPEIMESIKKHSTFGPASLKKIEDALKPQEVPAHAVDEEYAKQAKEATTASSLAHSWTNSAKEAFDKGEHAPENAQKAAKDHSAAMQSHERAGKEHNKAAEKAPTPELKKFHDDKGKEHGNHALVHSEAMKKHEKQHKQNVALKNYADEKKKADASSFEAEQSSKHAGDSDTSHGIAADLHEAAAKSHTDMIQHALNVDISGDGHTLANKHAAKATEHQKKAAYHKAAAEAWKATNEVGENPAAKHSAAAQAAEEAGFKEATAKHDEQSAKHVAQHKAAKDLDAAEAEAAKASEATKKFKPYHDGHDSKGHLEAAAAHEAASVAHTKAENPHHAKHHADWAEHHKTWAAQAAEKEKGQAEPSNPWKGKNHMQIASAGHDAHNSGDYATAAQHYKHAAVVAHHNGDASQAQHLAQMAKDAMAKVKSVQKAVNPQALMVGIQEAARQLHQERSRIRYFGKAMKDLPSSGRLHDACAKATAAGITDIDDIVSHALGGRKQAEPYLAFLAEVSQ